MNMQAIMAQAQKMQRDLLKQKEEIGKKLFPGKSELVEVVFNGNKELVSINIKKNNPIDVDDIEILEDMIKIAVKDSLQKVDNEINDKMGAAAGPLSGLL